MGKTVFVPIRPSHKEQAGLSLACSVIISPEFTCSILCFILSYCRAIRLLFPPLLELCSSGDPFHGGRTGADCGLPNTDLIKMSCGVAACSEVTGNHTIYGI